MSELTRVVVPYESMDPLAIGATDDESKKHRDTLEIEIPSANLVAVVSPTSLPRSPMRPRPRAPLSRPRSTVRRSPTCSQASAASPSSSTTSSDRRLRRSSFPPCSTRSTLPASRTSASAAPTGRSSRCPTPTPSRRSAGQPRPDGAQRLVVLPERPAEPGRVHVRRRVVGRNTRLAAERGRVGRRRRSRSARRRPTTGAPAAAES